MARDQANQDEDLQELGERLRRGDVEALQKLFKQLGPTIFGQIAYRFEGILQSYEIEEILGVALFDLWRQRERYDPKRGPILSWFYLLARHAAVDWLRRRRRFQTPEPAGEKQWPIDSPKLPVNLSERLEGLLAAQSEEDRDILLTFAASGGEGSWAEDVGKKLGISANVVSQRKKRLLAKLRQTLLTTPTVPSDDLLVDEEQSMSPSAKWAKQLECHLPDLKKLGIRLAEAAENAAVPGAQLRNRFARQWNEVLREKEDPARQARLEMLKRSWAWMEGLLGAGEVYRRELRQFVEHCRKELSESTLFKQPKELIVERLEQGVVGVADAIERRMPSEIRRKRVGDIQFEWDDSKGRLDAECEWKEHFTGPKIPMFQTASTSMQTNAEMEPEEAEACAGVFLRDLKVGTVALPDFRRLDEKHQTPKVTTLRWQPEIIEPVSANFPVGPLTEVDERFDLELALWRDFPEAAAAVDEAICAAVAADFRRASQAPSDASLLAAKAAETPTHKTIRDALAAFRKQGNPNKGAELSEALQVIHKLQSIIGRSEEEIVLLLAPLVETRGETVGSPIPCPDRQQTLAFLWAHITEQ